MKALYDRVASTEKGARSLADARLRYEVLSVLHRALKLAGINQTQLASRLGIKKSAVSQTLRGDGNLRVSTIAEYLQALGFELTLELVPAGEPRRRRTGGVDAPPALWPSTDPGEQDQERV